MNYNRVSSAKIAGWNTGLSREREAEIRGYTHIEYPSGTKQAIRDLLTELDRLRKRVDNLEARTGDLDGETP